MHLGKVDLYLMDIKYTEKILLAAFTLSIMNERNWSDIRPTDQFEESSQKKLDTSQITAYNSSFERMDEQSNGQVCYIKCCRLKYQCVKVRLMELKLILSSCISISLSFSLNNSFLIVQLLYNSIYPLVNHSARLSIRLHIENVIISWIQFLIEFF